jgi:hypothetical protein
MSTLKIGENLTLEIGDFIIIAWGNRLDYGWYCGQGRDKTTLQYYSLSSPGYALEQFKKFEEGDRTSWRVEHFTKHGFTSKAFYKSYLNSYYESRFLKVADPDSLFTNAKQIEEYNKSKEALIKIKFLNK